MPEDADPADRQRAIRFIRAEAELAMSMDEDPDKAGAFDQVADLLDTKAADEIRAMRDERDAETARREEAENALEKMRRHHAFGKTKLFQVAYYKKADTFLLSFVDDEECQLAVVLDAEQAKMLSDHLASYYGNTRK